MLEVLILLLAATPDAPTLETYPDPAWRAPGSTLVFGPCRCDGGPCAPACDALEWQLALADGGPVLADGGPGRTQPVADPDENQTVAPPGLVHGERYVLRARYLASATGGLYAVQAFEGDGVGPTAPLITGYALPGPGPLRFTGTPSTDSSSSVFRYLVQIEQPDLSWLSDVYGPYDRSWPPGYFLGPGTHELRVVAEDRALNRSQPSQSHLVTVTANRGPPVAPTGPACAKPGTYQAIVFPWRDAGDDWATQLSLDGGAWEPHFTARRALSFHTAGLSRCYHFRGAAVGPGFVTDWSAAHVLCVDGQRPQTPVLSAAADGGVVALAWDVPDDDYGVTGFALERASDGGWSLLADTDAGTLAWVDAPGAGTFAYRLAARDCAGNASLYAQAGPFTFEEEPAVGVDSGVEDAGTVGPDAGPVADGGTQQRPSAALDVGCGCSGPAGFPLVLLIFGVGSRRSRSPHPCEARGSRLALRSVKSSRRTLR